jgi:hypothetical protein
VPQVRGGLDEPVHCAWRRAALQVPRVRALGRGRHLVLHPPRRRPQVQDGGLQQVRRGQHRLLRRVRRGPALRRGGLRQVGRRLDAVLQGPRRGKTGAWGRAAAPGLTACARGAVHASGRLLKVRSGRDVSGALRARSDGGGLMLRARSASCTAAGARPRWRPPTRPGTASWTEERPASQPGWWWVGCVRASVNHLLHMTPSPSPPIHPPPPPPRPALL